MRTLIFSILGLLLLFSLISSCQRHLEVQVDISTNYSNNSLYAELLFLDSDRPNLISKDSSPTIFASNHSNWVYPAGRTTLKHTFDNSSYYSVIASVGYYSDPNDLHSLKVFTSYVNGEVPYNFLFFPLPMIYIIRTNGLNRF